MDRIDLIPTCTCMYVNSTENLTLANITSLLCSLVLVLTCTIHLHVIYIPPLRTCIYLHVHVHDVYTGNRAGH